MKARLQEYIEKFKNYWQEKNKTQKGIFIGSVVFFIVFMALLVFFLTRTPMVPLYSDLTPQETGSIKEALDARGIPSEIADGGTTILVPEDQVESLLVELAAEGIPESGNIDYSFFSENVGLGMTDNEFNVMKLDAMQTELAKLIESIDGIKKANVMINLPEKGIFVQDENQEASASIVLTVEPGYNFSENQIRALYTLVSKTIPNLPTDNIVIMDQNFQYYDLNNGANLPYGNQFEAQYSIKKEIERDIQRQVQSLLGSIMGHNNVVVSVTADIDFTQENRTEDLVEPVDLDNMEGITISAQRLEETYTGEGAAGGVPQAEDPGDTFEGGTYVEGTGDSGDYERTEETINKEVNRIRKEIVESPYKIRDIGIQVIAEPPAEDSGIVPGEIEADIEQILGTIIRTSIDKSELAEELTDADMADKIAVSFQPLLGQQDAVDEIQASSSIPVRVYVVIAILVLVIIIFIFILVRRKRTNETLLQEELERELERKQEPINLPDINEEVETEETVRMKRIEKMAKEKPDELVKLLRTWLSQD